MPRILVNYSLVKLKRYLYEELLLSLVSSNWCNINRRRNCGYGRISGAVIERLTGSSSLGIPYQIGVSIAGASLAVFLLYCSYLLIAWWSAHRLLRAIRVLTVILIVDAIAATTAFFLVTGILNIVSLLWLCMALAFGTIVLVLVHKLLAETIPDNN